MTSNNVGREPAKGGSRLAQSGLGQTQIIGDLIGESEEGKMRGGGGWKHDLGVWKWQKFKKADN